MLKVLSVNKFIYLFSCLFIIGCGIKKNSLIDKSIYKIKKFRTLDSKYSYIHINTYDKEIPDNNIPATIKINNILFSKKKIFNVSEGKHNIFISFFNKGRRFNNYACLFKRLLRGFTLTIKKPFY